MKVPVSSVVVRDRVRKDLGDISSLMKSMKDHGQLNPIALTRDYELIAGHRRLLAAQRMSWQHIEAHVVERDSAIEKLELELEENVHRKDFSPEELLDGFRKLEKLKQPPLSRRLIDVLRRFFRKLFRNKPPVEQPLPDPATPDGLPEPSRYGNIDHATTQPAPKDETPYGI